MNLAEQLAAKIAEAEALLKAAEDEDRLMTEEEQVKAESLQSEIDSLKAQIEAQEQLRKKQAQYKEKLAAARKFTETPTGRIVPAPAIGTDGATVAGALDGGFVGVPSFVRRMSGRSLKNFKGDNAAEEAYAAGQFFLATIWDNRDAAAWCEKNSISLAAGIGQDSKGGALVPDFLAQTIIDLREQYGVFRANARVVGMPRDTYTVPRRTGGVTAYFVGENSEITASDKSWDQVSLTARKLAALCKYSSEIAEDSIISIADDLAGEIAYAFASKEDACGFKGDGTSTYGGISGLITNAGSASVVTAATGNTAFSTLDLADFEGMIGKLPTYAEGNAKWFISKAGWAASMMRLADAAGGITYTEILSGRRVPVFLGYPVVFAQTMNSTLTAQTTTKGLCYFGDLAMAATMGERRGLTIDSSAERYFEYDQLAIRGTERVDIVVHDAGDSTNAGAIVMLSTPGS